MIFFIPISITDNLFRHLEFNSGAIDNLEVHISVAPVPEFSISGSLFSKQINNTRIVQILQVVKHPGGVALFLCRALGQEREKILPTFFAYLEVNTSTKLVLRQIDQLTSRTLRP